MENGEPLRVKLPQNATIIFSCGLVLVAVMLAVVAWTLADARGAARHQAETAASNLTLTLERDLGSTMNAFDRSLRAAVQGMATQGLAEMTEDVRNAILFNGAIGSNRTENIYITNEDGRVIYDSRNLGGPRPNLANRQCFQAHRAQADRGLFIGNPVYLIENGRLGICLARRINHPDGSFAGVAAVGLPIDNLLSLFSGIAVSDFGAIILSDTQGRVIVRWPYSEQDVGRDLSGNPMPRLLLKSPFGKFEAKSRTDGETRIYFYRQVENFPLVVGAGLASREVYAQWNRRTTIVGTVVLLLCLFGVTLAHLLCGELRRRAQAEEAAKREAATAEHLAGELSRAVAPIETLFNNSVDTMLVIRRGSDGDFVYEAVNPTWQSVVGVPSNAAIGHSPRACLPPLAAEKLLAAWTETAQERRPVRVDLEFPPQSGRHWDIVTLPIIGNDGDVTRLIVVGRDVTEQNRLAAAELQQAQKIEVMGQLAAGISHDFNNILQVISGGVELIGDEGALSNAGATLLEMVQRAASRGASLTRQLLDYSRKQGWNPELLDLADVFNNLRVILSRTLGTHIVVTIEVALDVGLVRADRGQLETAVMNLAINASHAMADGGVLRFDVSQSGEAPFKEMEAGRNVVIAVTDSGCGIQPDVLARIFDPFFTTKGAAGNGLGLAMVQRFARQSGGDVRVMSTVGKGTRFEIWLSEFDEPASPGSLVSESKTMAQEGNVLLVDDAEDVLIIVAAFLRAGGFTVHQASSGQQALWALVAGTRFDLLITDHMLPVMKGAELIRRVRQMQPDLPALVISGFADAVDQLKDMPDVKVLMKPFQRGELIEAVGRLVARGPKLTAMQADTRLATTGLDTAGPELR